jgi:hypothetical protein
MVNISIKKNKLLTTLKIKTMKQIILLLLLSVSFYASAQNDPFDNLKKESSKLPVIIKTGSAKTVVTADEPIYNLHSKTPITNFKPFTLTDSTGKSIPPNQMVTLKNGKQMTAQEYVTQLNAYEAKFNAIGHSLHTEKNVEISNIVTDKKNLDGKVALFPKILRPRFSRDELTELLRYDNKFGDYVLRPSDQMTQQDRLNNSSIKFSVVDNKIKTERKSAIKGNNSLPKTDVSNLLVSSLPYSWHPINTNLGDKSTVYVGFDLSYTSDLEIYSPNGNDSRKNKSSYNASGNASIACALFGNEFDVFKANATYYAPADRTKKTTASCVVSILGDNVVNKKSDNVDKLFTANYSQGFDKGYSIQIPIWDGINFDGRVGVAGNIGVQCNLGPGAQTDDFTNSISVGPVADLSGYAQVGADFLGIVGAGVGGNLTVFKGDITIGSNVTVANLYSPGALQIPVNTSFGVDYGITLLSGDLYVYAQECIPGLSLIWDGACWEQTANIFSWGGYTDNGVIAQESHAYVYSLEPALSADLSKDGTILNTLPQIPTNITRAYSVTPLTAGIAAPKTATPAGGTGNTILVFYKKSNGLEQATVFGDMVIDSKIAASLYWSWIFDAYADAANDDATLKKLDAPSLRHLFDKAKSAYPNANINTDFALSKISDDDAAKKIKNITDTYTQYQSSILK